MIKPIYLVVCLVLSLGLTLITGHDLKGFDDTILFNINWPGKSDLILERPIEEETLYITTPKKDKYVCSLPSLATKENESHLPYTGPGPLDIISSLFTSSTCSYRIDSYWTYEVCHGNYIKQYHEEREGKTSKVQEYFLGLWNKSKTDKLREKLAQAQNDGEKLKYKKIDGLSLPYLELEMTDGTLCDLINNQPRTTKVLYVCYAHGKNEVYSLNEVSSCNYEIIILTSSLCAHPSFKPQITSENNINCTPLFNAPDMPKSLYDIEVETLKKKYHKLTEATKGFQNIAVFKVDPKDGSLRMEVLQGSESFAGSLTDTTLDEIFAQYKEKPQLPKITTKPLQDTSPVIAFLQGKNCLTGGTGWWKYEFCYGRYVRQFHIDKDGEKSVILGLFNKDLHKQWLHENESKRPKMIGARTHLSHFYQGGTMCEKTGKERQTEVKLKCMDRGSDNTKSLSDVSLYLMEPKTCEYVLGVESPLICDILQKADEYGLMPIDVPADETATTTATTDEGILLGNAIVEDIEVRFEND